MCEFFFSESIDLPLHYSAPWFIPTMNMSDYETHDLDKRFEEAERKQSIATNQGDVKA